MAQPESFAAQLLDSARRDVTAWHRLVVHADVHDSVLGFHAQQAVEKALKSVLASAGIAFRRTHDIVELLDTLAAHQLPPPPHAATLDRLNPFAVEARYGFPTAGLLDRDRGGQELDAILDWAAAQADGPPRPS